MGKPTEGAATEPVAQRVDAVEEPGTSVDQAATAETVAAPTDADAVVTAINAAATRLPTHEDPHLLARSAMGVGSGARGESEALMVAKQRQQRLGQ